MKSNEAENEEDNCGISIGFADAFVCDNCICRTADTATPDEPVSMRYEVISVKNSPKVYTENDVTLVDYPIYDYDDDYLFEGNYELKVSLEALRLHSKTIVQEKFIQKFLTEQSLAKLSRFILLIRLKAIRCFNLCFNQSRILDGY